MERVYKGTRITTVQADITEQKVDAIVNAANARLAGGSGVDGAIHRKGGPSIAQACAAFMESRQGKPLSDGDTMVTPAGELPCQWVVHAVGPVWSGGARGELVALERAWEKSLELAREHGAKTIAFPSISTGAYGFPIERAAFIAGNTIARFCQQHPGAFHEIRIALFSKSDFTVWSSALDEVITTMTGTGG